MMKLIEFIYDRNYPVRISADGGSTHFAPGLVEEIFDAYEKYKSQKSAIPIVSEWVAVTDRLPELNDWVLCGHTKDEWTDLAEINQDGKGKIVFWNRECEIYPTHWCKLPGPPCG